MREWDSIATCHYRVILIMGQPRHSKTTQPTRYSPPNLKSEMLLSMRNVVEFLGRNILPDTDGEASDIHGPQLVTEILDHLRLSGGPAVRQHHEVFGDFRVVHTSLVLESLHDVFQGVTRPRVRREQCVTGNLSTQLILRHLSRLCGNGGDLRGRGGR